VSVEEVPETDAVLGSVLVVVVPAGDVVGGGGSIFMPLIWVLAPPLMSPVIGSILIVVFVWIVI